MATELVKGKKVEDALEITNKAVIEALDGLPAPKIHCSVLAEEAIKAAILEYYERNGMDTSKITGCTGCCSNCHSCGEGE